MVLRNVAHGRAGDKGLIVNLSVIAFEARDYDWLETVLTPERVRAHLGHLAHGPVVRYVLPNLQAMNFVLSRPPGQSVTRTLAIDAHGKALSSRLLEMELGERIAD